MACETELANYESKQQSLATAVQSAAQLSAVLTAAIAAYNAATNEQDRIAAYNAMEAAAIQVTQALAIVQTKTLELEAAWAALKLCQDSQNSPPPGP